MTNWMLRDAAGWQGMEAEPKAELKRASHRGGATWMEPLPH